MKLKDLFGKRSSQKETAAQNAVDGDRADAEFEAKYAVKTERKKVEKLMAEMDKSIGVFMAQAAEAKQKGYEEMYRKSISFIKVAKARKKQAEMFLFQIVSMQEMQNIANHSKQLLGSMNNIMNTLGKLSVDKSVVIQSQRDYQKTMAELDRQSDTIDNALSNFEAFAEDGDYTSDVSLSDDEIEAEIDAMIEQNGGVAPSAQAAADSMDYFKSLASN